jgi:gliding motility-associated-like protein
VPLFITFLIFYQKPTCAMPNLPISRFNFLILACLFNCMVLQAQVSNDNCNTATVLSNVADTCYTSTNRNATASSNPSRTSCSARVTNDVWFTFRALGNVATISVNGGFNALLGPGVAIYRGTCDVLQEFGCQSSDFLETSVRLSTEGLTPGQTYFIRVYSAASTGNFRLCLTQTNATPFWDCPTAQKVCTTDPISIPRLFGAGVNTNELDDASCFGALTNDVEQSSAWLTFTAANSGNLEFTLTPNDPRDDLDFVLYRLTNGNCNTKVVQRCMAAGDFNIPSACMGPTGLNATSTFTEMPPGCDFPQRGNFLRFLPLQAGATYALVVLNITDGEDDAPVPDGFRVQWGGTARFALSRNVIFPQDTTIATGTSATLTVRPTAGNTLPAITWSGGTTATGPAITVTPQDTLTRYIVRAEAEACSSGGTDTVLVRTVKPIWDCPIAQPVYCEKDGINIAATFHGGLTRTELDNATCLPRPAGGTPETSPAWFTFTAKNNGTLDFTLTPNDRADNLDFVVYRMPNGNCNTRIVERCMAASDASATSPCMGPTGLSASGTATSLGAGCTGTTNFLQSLRLQKDMTYALVVLNNTASKATRSTREGFRLQWGGSAQFKWIDFPKDTTIEEGASVTLTTVPVQGIVPTVNWQSLNSSIDRRTGTSILVTPTDSVAYQVTATAPGNACPATDTVIVRVQKIRFDMPNLFSPNNDEVNNIFRPVMTGYTLVKLEVYSRWGQKVYDSAFRPGTSGWDGTMETGEEAPIDVYYYRVAAQRKNGEVVQRDGEINLIR